MHDEGKCFTYSSTTHIEHNCPQWWRTKDKLSEPTLCTNTVGLSSVEACLAALQEGTTIGLYMTELRSTTTCNEGMTVVQHALSTLQVAVPLVLDRFDDP